MTVWVAFPDEPTFTAWHDAQCATFGIPFPGETSSGYALAAQWTTAAVMPVLIDGTIAAELTEEQIAGDATLSGLPQIERTPESVVEPVPFPVAKELPDTWHDPAGTAYSVPQTREVTNG